MKKFKFIDLFSGVGGMRIGFEKASLKHNILSDCVFSCDLDEKSNEVYFENFFIKKHFKDIKKINSEKINHLVPDHDVLLAGFPCQPFSSAGVVKRKYLNRPHGLSDKKYGNLIFKIIDILNKKQPKAFLLENVKYLKKHNKGKTLKKIIDLLRVNYYVPDPKVLNSKHFGLPQSRERVFIIGFKKKYGEFNYPLPSFKKTKVQDILDKKVDSTFTISNKLWLGHLNRKRRNKKKGKGFGFSLCNPKDEYTRTITSRYLKDGSECLIEQTNNKNPRFLTPRECFRLQGFPNNFKLSKFKTHAYKQAGNSVPINVIEAISGQIIQYLLKKNVKKKAA